MKRTLALLAPLALLAGPASATTWDFEATSCFGQSSPNACTGVPATPFVLGTFTADSGPGSSMLSGGVKIGDTDFSLNFGRLFVIENGIQIPAGHTNNAVDWNIAWGGDDKPTLLSFDTVDSNLRLFGDTIETASDTPDLVGCRTFASCVFAGFWREASAVPEPGTMGLMLVGLLGMAGLRRQRRT